MASVQPFPSYPRPVERRSDAGRSGHDGGDGVDDPGRRGDKARVVVIAVRTAQAEVECVCRFAGDLDAIRPALLSRLRPVRAQVVAKPGDMLEDDGGLAVDHAANLETQRRGASLLDMPRRDVEVLRRWFANVGLAHLVERNTEA